MSDQPEQNTEETQKTDSQDSTTATPQVKPEVQTTESTFTQKDVDSIVEARLKRERETVMSKLLEQLGVEKLEDAQALVTSEKKRKEAEMSELEKAQAQIDAANKKAQEALEAKQALEQKILANARQQAFLKAATSRGGKSVDDLFILVQAKHSDDFLGVFAEDGSADDKKMEKFIADIQKSFPSYFGSAGAGSPSNEGGVAPNEADFTEEASANWLRQLRS